MRRGLIAWSKAELPEAVFDARAAKAQAAMAQAGWDALLVYTNNTRPAGASWLCGFVPYWSEAMLVLPRAGQPYIVAALTKRVHPWLQSVSRISHVVSAPRLGTGAAREIGGGKVAAVADLDGLPAGIVEDLRAGGLTLADATHAFIQMRGRADPAELALAAHAAAIAHGALASAQPEHDEASEVVASVEAWARADGAEECYVAIAPDLRRERNLTRLEGTATLGPSYAVRATVAYKGAWVRLARTVFRDERRAAIATAAADRFAGAVASLPDARGFAGTRSWLVEACRVAQPLEPMMGARIAEPRPLPAGALVSVQASFEQDGEPVLLGAPALLGAAGEPASLLVPPVFRTGD